jgi:acyl-CoA thioester hydrolase
MTGPALTHRLPLRVYYEDTDFSGVVYHASYLRFMERGRTEFLREAGVMQRDWYAGPERFFFVVRKMTIEWLKPARMDDQLVVETSVTEVRGASLVMKQAVTRDGEALVTAGAVVVGVIGERAARLPPPLKAALLALLTPPPS